MELLEDALDRSLAYGRVRIHDVPLRRCADELLEICAQHAFAAFGARCNGESPVKLLVAGRHHAEHVGHERGVVVLAVLPPGGAWHLS